MKVMVVIAFIGVLFFSAISNAATFIYFNSEEGDYIGQGIEQTLTSDDGTFNATVFDNGVTFYFQGTTFWSLSFAAPEEETLKPGAYENASRYPFQSPTHPGLDISGDGRGCNQSSGRFDILEISYTSEGEIDRFAADFEQHCEFAEPALFGSIRYNATVGFPLKVNIKANGSHTPISIKVGQTVKISATIDSGDDEGILAEHWLGMTGTYGAQWRNGKKWNLNPKQPKMWFYRPISNKNYTFNWKPKAQGIYMFQFIVDKQINKKPNTQFVDHVVITVLPN